MKMFETRNRHKLLDKKQNPAVVIVSLHPNRIRNSNVIYLSGLSPEQAKNNIKEQHGGVRISFSLKTHMLPMGLHGFPWVHMGSHGLPWVPMGSHEFPWVPMGYHGFPWVHMGYHGSHGCTWVPMGSHGFPKGSHGFPCVSMGSKWVSMGSHGFPWVHMGSNGFPWVPMGSHGYRGPSWVSKVFPLFPVGKMFDTYEGGGSTM